jgi:hypothetical protein
MADKSVTVYDHPLAIPAILNPADPAARNADNMVVVVFPLKPAAKSITPFTSEMYNPEQHTASCKRLEVAVDSRQPALIEPCFKVCLHLGRRQRSGCPPKKLYESKTTGCQLKAGQPEKINCFLHILNRNYFYLR